MDEGATTLLVAVAAGVLSLLWVMARSCWWLAAAAATGASASGLLLPTYTQAVTHRYWRPKETPAPQELLAVAVAKVRRVQRGAVMGFQTSCLILEAAITDLCILEVMAAAEL